MPVQHPTYTDDQLETYLRRIEYPRAAPTEIDGSQLQQIREGIKTNPLHTLAHLQRCHLTAIPWGNSGLHYSQHHTISLDPDSLYEKMVERRLDGYCMESSGLFFVVLRSLGYRVYATGGRVSHAAASSRGVDDGLYLSLGHMILIVIIDGEKYMVSSLPTSYGGSSYADIYIDVQVDVGFGNNCATAPLPLREGATATCIAPCEMRLVRDSLAEFMDKDQKVWIYQTRHNVESNWIPNICFADVEFLPQDFGVMNFSVSQTRTSWFTQAFVCVRMILDESGTEIIGQYMMVDKEVKRRVRGQTEILQVLHSEQDRIEALAKYFDMHLRDSEIRGIRGLTSELK
ncbi:hypothetical protein N7474_007326 [Penicillium riverlandense]|uniref:uncharacterized protein n=1 Tax=Penicillium riverlandense TaxID=1903569 RepID=UPI0025484A7E|nr:uncharacterized protein N7474_007326 [Penicillium riverlandense]KAJ5815549.1 hypothetical protein N7474_007326 [Penicillium riverlandense]